MSLVMGISSVYFANSLPNAKQKAAARELIATIKYAKKLAAVRNERQLLNFDLDNGSYGIKGRELKSLPGETKLVIYESDVNADPITKGQYHIAYDSTGSGNWDRISLVRGDRIIEIKSDPILTALMVGNSQRGRHE